MQDKITTPQVHGTTKESLLFRSRLSSAVTSKGERALQRRLIFFREEWRKPSVFNWNSNFLTEVMGEHSLLPRFSLYPETIPKLLRAWIMWGTLEMGSDKYNNKSSAYRDTLCSPPPL